MPETSVHGLIGLARAGDRGAQDELLGRYRSYLSLLARMSFARALRSKLDASDVVQDVLVSAHGGLGQFRGETEAELTAWLRRILSNRLAEVNRRFFVNQGRRVDREVRLDDAVARSSQSLAGLPAARGTSPSRGAERREAGALVADALSALKDDDREVIVLRSLEEHDWPEIGRRIGRHPEAARALWVRALRRLSAVVKEERWTLP